jgi:hypothetical protein
MVPVDSRWVSRAPRYSGTRFEPALFSPTRLSRSMAGLSRSVWLTGWLVTLLLRALQPPCILAELRVWAESEFARRYYRNRCCFLFLQVLRWFTSLGLLHPPILFSGQYAEFIGMGFPIRRSPDQSLFAAPRSLSQLTTSFVASWRQGIHRTPLVA